MHLIFKIHWNHILSTCISSTGTGKILKFQNSKMRFIQKISTVQYFGNTSWNNIFIIIESVSYRAIWCVLSDANTCNTQNEWISNSLDKDHFHPRQKIKKSIKKCAWTNIHLNITKSLEWKQIKHWNLFNHW